MRKNLHPNPLPGGKLQQVNFKVIAAAGLLIVMALLWLRVFLRKGPQEAKAAESQLELIEQIQTQSQTQTTASKVRIEKIRLPYTAGVHDRISNNPFEIHSARWLDPDAQPESIDPITDEKILKKQDEKNIRSIGEQLAIEAIIQGPDGKLKAFIRGQVLHTGSRFTVQKDKKKYDFVVGEITDNSLVLNWQAFSITVVMSPSFQMD